MTVSVRARDGTLPVDMRNTTTILNCSYRAFALRHKEWLHSHVLCGRECVSINTCHLYAIDSITNTEIHFYIASAREGSLGKLRTGPLTNFMIRDIYSTRSLATTCRSRRCSAVLIDIDGLQLGSSEPHSLDLQKGCIVGVELVLRARNSNMSCASLAATTSPCSCGGLNRR